MKQQLFFLMLFSIISCQTIKINDKKIKKTDSHITLGAVGESTSLISLKHFFTIKSYPTIKERLKLDISIVPFTKRAYKIYQSKGKFNQKQLAINYVDSLPIKPEMVFITISDISTLASDINSNENIKEFSFIKNNEKTTIVTNVLVVLNDQEIEKIRNADTYYLVQTAIAKYNISLYKSGKKVEMIDISNATILGYGEGKFCWFENDRGKWQIGDIVQKGNSCQGNTYSKVKQKKERSLYKM